MDSTVAIIPAYEPEPSLVELVEVLIEKGLRRLLLVDDGSGTAFSHLFSDLGRRDEVTVLTHSGNQGKGAALKTAFQHVLDAYPDCSRVITLDADGQHRPHDVVHLVKHAAEHPDAVVLGVREFGSDVPLRSRLGNRLTSSLFRLIYGKRIADTQTGLRVIPRPQLSSLLEIKSDGYEFEMEMVVRFVREERRLIEVPIETVYIDGNSSSHFNPLIDSMKIYFIFFRFLSASLAASLLDFCVFSVAYWITDHLLLSLVIGRVGSVILNFVAVKYAVFRSSQHPFGEAARFLLLVLVILCVHYVGLRLLTASFELGVLPARMITETSVFVGSFLAQRFFVFSSSADDAGATS